MAIGNFLIFLGLYIFVFFPFMGLTGYLAIIGVISLSIGKSLSPATIWAVFPLIVER